MIYYCGYDQYVNLKYIVSFTINEQRGMYHFRFNLINGASVAYNSFAKILLKPSSNDFDEKTKKKIVVRAVYGFKY